MVLYAEERVIKLIWSNTTVDFQFSFSIQLGRKSVFFRRFIVRTLQIIFTIKNVQQLQSFSKNEVLYFHKEVLPWINSVH